jgi:hypothetical protein
LKLGDPEHSLINDDIHQRLEPVARAISIEQIADWADRIEQIFLALPRNVNRQLAMESLLVTP